MNVEFPIYLLAKDCGEIEQIRSVNDLQNRVEKIDIENGEYLAWDKSGKVVSLAVQDPVWVKIEPRPDLEQAGLKTALEKYAAVLGVHLEFEETSEGFKRGFEQIETEVERRSQTKLFRRIVRRFR